jgi:hypothetical protein
MHGINLKPVAANPMPVAATTSKPALDSSVWRSKLEDNQHSDKLVELVKSAGLITREQYCDAMEIAESLGKSIDQVLATSILSEEQAKICEGALSYLERGIINENLAADAVRLASAKQLSFFEALKYFGFGW